MSVYYGSKPHKTNACKARALQLPGDNVFDSSLFSPVIRM